MDTVTKTDAVESREGASTTTLRRPALLVAYTDEPDLVAADRCAVGFPFVVGRSPRCQLPLNSKKVSARHFRIDKTEAGYFAEDLQSTNGTFLNGTKLGKRQISNGDMLRIPGAIFVFIEDGSSVLEPCVEDRLGIQGQFHAGAILRELKEASASKRHMFIAGPSGCGKELAARDIARYTGAGEDRFYAHNCARFSSEEEATSSLFGVATKVFSSVNERAGLIETAHGGVLFLDEIHNLPIRVQRSLLRVIEDGVISRIGETAQRKVEVRFVLASNIPGPDFGLAPDLLARLRDVQIPTLKDRRADIPELFEHTLETTLRPHGIDLADVWKFVSIQMLESMMLDGFPVDNVRGLLNLADRIATAIAVGSGNSDAVGTVLESRFPLAAKDNEAEEGDDRKSRYDRNRAAIVEAFKECEGNLSAMERRLRSSGVPCSRRWLSVFLEKWGVR